MNHMTEGFSLRPDHDGWYRAQCVCGWKGGPFPDVEIMVDELMDHAYAAGLRTRNASLDEALNSGDGTYRP